MLPIIPRKCDACSAWKGERHTTAVVIDDDLTLRVCDSCMESAARPGRYERNIDDEALAVAVAVDTIGMENRRARAQRANGQRSRLVMARRRDTPGRYTVGDHEFSSPSQGAAVSKAITLAMREGRNQVVQEIGKPPSHRIEVHDGGVIIVRQLGVA